MYKVESVLEGIAPLRFNRFFMTKIHKPTLEQEYELARQRLYENSNGIYVPSFALKRALRFGSTMGNLKMGRRSLEPYINAGVFIEPLELELGKKDPDYNFEAYVRIPPGKKGAMVFKVRPCMNVGWQLSPIFTVMDDHILEDMVRMALETAGIYVGLLDGRPEYGRFIVKNWKVVKK
jgi:hypothetical protein